jgi:ABC-type branched-subunit amino acid transport system substrate-binding protein
VTADTITVANISTITGPIPGLGASAVGATRAYVAYKNATGGVCGRKIVLKTADDGNDNGQFRALATEFTQQALGLVGDNAGADGGGADVIETNKVPVVAVAFTTAFQNVSTVFDMNPSPADIHAVTAKYKYLLDQGAQKVALITLADEAAVAQLDEQQAQMEAAGIQVVNRQILPLSTLSFDSAARAVANSGADYLFFLSASSQDASMAQSMADTGYHLKFAEYLTAYGSNFLDLAGASGEGATSWIRSLPNEESGNAEQATFLQWIGQTAPDVYPDTFAADAWASAKAFFDALEQLPGPISRDALVTQLRTYTAYDAGGLEGTINLAGKVSNGCFIAMKVESGVWKRMTPDQGFLC